jgi:hypothetical protein
MVGGLRLERWAPSRQNDGRHQIGIGGRLTSESAALLPLMDLSISKSASIRRTTWIAIGESTIVFLPAVYDWARVATQHDARRGSRYAALRARGHSHGRALRTVADRLLGMHA